MFGQTKRYILIIGLAVACTQESMVDSVPEETDGATSDNQPSCSCPEVEKPECPMEPPVEMKPDMGSEDAGGESESESESEAEAPDPEPEVVASLIPLTPLSLERENRCSEFSYAQLYAVTEDEPRRFLIQPTPEYQYCVEVIRESGFVSLLYEEGYVTRDSDLFTWCITRDTWEDLEEDPALLVVNALTETAEFRIKLQRGM